MTPHRGLVVDDAATVRLYHRKLLADAGWLTEEAGNGLEALEHVQSQDATAQFALYVVDVNMPKMDGYRFVRALRQLERRHQAPVVMVSTEAQAQDQQGALDAGANASLVKPARPGALVLTAALVLADRAQALDAARKVTA